MFDDKLLYGDLKRLIETLNSEPKLVYAIVGGLALKAWSGGRLDLLRENGTIRDIDIVVMDDSCGVVDKVRRMNLTLPVEFNVAKICSYRQPFQLLSHFKKVDDSRYSIIFREVEYILPSQVVELYSVSLEVPDGLINFKTFNPLTLVHLYIHRMGSMRVKDLLKLKKFLRKVRNQSMCNDEHSYYEVFHEYSSSIRKSYRIYSSLIRLYNYIDHAVFGSLISHRFIPRSVVRFLVNL